MATLVACEGKLQQRKLPLEEEVGTKTEKAFDFSSAGRVLFLGYISDKKASPVENAQPFWPFGLES